jgi:TolB-like protein/Tfp pilus assembly protein PilF
MALTLGTQLGPYQVLSPLGAGGMGEVYRARDTRLARDVALKALPAEFARDPERLARFRREAQTLAGLNHPNIAAIYGLEESGGTPLFVLELVAGETLSQRLARGSLPLRDVLPIAIQIAAAVEAAHERGVVHRDLKPGNVMITPAGAVKVLDFGLAKSDPASDASLDGATCAETLEATAEGVVLGTAAYMSPEQARGRPVDRRSDVWSFGCVLFECLAGRAPFTGDTVSDRIARILEREPDWPALPSDVPARMREILRRCLRKDADDRPRDIRDVRLELADLAASGGKAASAAAAREKSIAVLPFENQSGADDEYFADGVTDEILNALAQVEGLRVAARASCFAFKGRREDLRAIGEKLDVATVLEGTVRRAGSRLRITTQLANAADGYQLWSERYDREMTDVFEVQDEIAKVIATKLRGALHGEADRSRVRAGTKNLEAYELLLRGRALQNKRGRFMSQARACFEKAVALDPGYAEPLAWLSDSYRLMGTFGAIPVAEAMSKGKELAERAIALDPGMSEAWATLAAVADQYDHDVARADSLYARALEIEPRNARIRAQWILWRVLRRAMRDESALAELRRAVHDDPLNAWVAAMHAFALEIVGNHEDSIAEAERALELDTESFFARYQVMRAYASAGRYERARGVAPELLMDSGRHVWVLALLAWTYARSGRDDLARATYEELEGRSGHEFVSRAWLSSAACSAGKAEDAVRWLEAAVRDHDPILMWMERMPFWDLIGTHPVLIEIRGKVRLGTSTVPG